MNERTKALLILSALFFFYVLLSIMESIDSTNTESNIDLNSNNLDMELDHEMQPINNNNNNDKPYNNKNGSSKSINKNDIKKNMENQLYKEKNVEMFDYLRWVFIVGEWIDNNNNGQKQFGDFEQQIGKIKLRFHFDNLNNGDFGDEVLDIYIYDGYYGDGRVENFQLKNGTFDFLQKKYHLVQNHTNISEFNLLTENSLHHLKCNLSMIIDLAGIVNTSDLHDEIQWNHDGEIKLILNSTHCPINIQANLKIDTEKHENKGLYYSMLITLLAVLMLYAIARMIKNCSESNHETNKLSLLTIGWLTTWDAYICISHLYLALSVDTMFHFFIMPTFWYFILFSTFELKLLLLIWKARYYDRYQNQEELRKDSAMFTGLILLYKFALNDIFLFMMSFYLVPQIIHNAIRGYRSELNSKWLCFMCASKFLLPLYFRGCPYNILEISPSFMFCFFLTGLIGAQMVTLYYQSILGSRFFVPDRFLPPKFNYLVNLPNKDAEAGYFEQFDDCVVCLRSLHQEPALNVDDNVQTRYLYKRLRASQNQVMRTPCDHKFHVKCLVNWMSYKMECPTCRAKLPIIEQDVVHFFCHHISSPEKIFKIRMRPL